MPVRPAKNVKATYHARGVLDSRTMSDTFWVTVVRSFPPRINSAGVVGSSLVLFRGSWTDCFIFQAPLPV